MTSDLSRPIVSGVGPEDNLIEMGVGVVFQFIVVILYFDIDF